MKTQSIILAFVITVLSFSFYSCEKEEIPFIKDKNQVSDVPTDTTDVNQGGGGGGNGTGGNGGKTVPVINGISPESGPKTTVVSIKGNNFGTDASNVKVYFNGLESTVNSVNNTEIIAVVPAKAYSGKVTITIGDKPADGPIFNYIVTEVYTSLVAGTQSGSTDGSVTDAKFKFPHDVAVDSQGNIFVADRENHKIRKITPNGMVSTFAGTGVAGLKNGSGLNAQFNFPSGIAIDNLDNLYVADFKNNNIRKITPQGVVSTFAGSGEEKSNDGIGLLASFHRPAGLDTDAQGNVYVADSKNNKIRKIDANGNVTTVAGSGIVGLKNGEASSAKFDNPLDVALDKDGNIFVTDHNNHVIRKISEGSVSTLAGSTAGDQDSIGTNARFNGPTGIAIDSKSNIYVSDFYNHKIKLIALNKSVTTIAGNIAGDDVGEGQNALFFFPTGLTTANNELLIVDKNNHKIKKLNQE